MKIIHRKDDTFVVTKNGRPYHVVKGMDDYDALLKSYRDDSSTFDEERPPVLPVIDHGALVRADRNQLLKDSDWTQIADCRLTSEQKSAWKKYRQALRDLPQQKNFPTVEWPRKPE